MKRVPVLISYAYAKCFDWDAIRKVADQIDLLIDCGAFTVHKQGKKITLDEYYDFLGEIDYPVDGYFALDSIGDPKKTWENFRDMQENGFEPIPIFTRGDQLRRLDEYYEYSDIVALGGLWAGGENDPGYVKHIMEKGFRGRKTHWLGFAIFDLILYYKPYSVDAINWKRALLYGQLVVWSGRKFFSASRKDFAGNRMPPIGKEIAKLGYDPYRLKQEDSWRGVCTYAHEIATVSFLKYVKDLKKRVGTKFYFVVNAQHELDFLLQLKEKGE